MAIDNSLLSRLERLAREVEACGLVREAIDEIKDLRRRLSLIHTCSTAAYPDMGDLIVASETQKDLGL